MEYACNADRQSIKIKIKTRSEKSIRLSKLKKGKCFRY